ncbi:MAG TPA: DUF4446 family protein [Actinomycetota bacterium]|nr:DUF4446 family protein [Actinomycetota bacterium]
MPDLNNDQLTLALAIVAGVGLLCLIIVLLLAMRLRKLRREYALLRSEDGDERDIFAAVGRSVRKLDAADKRLDALVRGIEEQAALGRFAIQKFGMVRYNAFEEMGGNLSFSLALLDDHGDGVVLTSISGRTEARIYAKPVKSLTSTHNLSDEEREAISSAVAGYERGESEAVASRSQ